MKLASVLKFGFLYPLLISTLNVDSFASMGLNFDPNSFLLKHSKEETCPLPTDPVSDGHVVVPSFAGKWKGICIEVETEDGGTASKREFEASMSMSVGRCNHKLSVKTDDGEANEYSHNGSVIKSGTSKDGFGQSSESFSWGTDGKSARFNLVFFSQGSLEGLGNGQTSVTISDTHDKLETPLTFEIKMKIHNMPRNPGEDTPTIASKTKIDCSYDRVKN